MSILEAISIRSRILCQDIRQEKTNKLILIGVYPSEIIFSTFPANAFIAFYIEADVLKDVSATLQARVRVNDEVQVEMGIDLPLEAGKTLVIPSPPLHLKFEAPGAVSIDFSDDGEEWVTLLERSTLLGPVETLISNEIGQLSGQSPSDAQGSDSPPEPSPRRGGKRKARL
jgi:hypothetical protein